MNSELSRVARASVIKKTGERGISDAGLTPLAGVNPLVYFDSKNSEREGFEPSIEL